MARANKGYVYFNSRSGKWAADCVFPDGRRFYTSPYRQDCEKWLENTIGSKSAADCAIDTAKAKAEIMRMGGINPLPVPGFTKAFLTDDGRLYSSASGRVIQRKLSKGRYYTMSNGKDSVSCTLERLRYCIDNNINPLVLSQCRLSVHKGLNETKLMDVTEHIREQMRQKREKRISSHAEEYMEIAENWCHNVLLFYRGNNKAATDLQNILNRLRPHLVAYIYDVLLLREENKVKFIIDEVMGETIFRTLERKAIIYSPYVYMQRLCRRYHAVIKKCSGKAFLEEGSVRIIGGWRKGTKRQIYNTAQTY